jgi:hypothetical protein
LSRKDLIRSSARHEEDKDNGNMVGKKLSSGKENEKRKGKRKGQEGWIAQS